MPPLDRILARILVQDCGHVTPCWVWPGATAGRGYGRIASRGRYYGTHRVVYEELVGPIPVGLVLDHLCENPSCCCPEHLQPVTQRENLLRSKTTLPGINARKTHCPSGHPYDEANTFISTRGYRLCRICQDRHRAASRLRAAS